MKKGFLMTIVFLGLLSCTNAQEGTSGGTGSRTQTDPSAIIDSRVADLTERLSLTPAQVAQVRAIYEKTMGTQTGTQGSGGSASLSSGAEQRHNEIMNLLNDKQKEIYAAYLKEREQQPQGGASAETGERQQGERPQMNTSSIIDSRVADLTERLSLTPAQVTQVRAIYEKTMASQSSSSAEQRHNEIMNILNAKQKEIYSAYLKEREQQTPGQAPGRTAPGTQL